MVLNRGNKLCNTNIFINDALIKCVKEFRYLCFTINAKNCNFSSTVKDLKIKAYFCIKQPDQNFQITYKPSN